MKSDRHYWATLNYVHHNPVHHRYAERWQDWPFSSAAAYLEAVGHETAWRTWKAYPILDYGKEWDPPER
jgi:putative transposase